MIYGHTLDSCTKAYVLRVLRSAMDAIHSGGNIYYNPGRFEAYSILALIASDIRGDK